MILIININRYSNINNFDQIENSSQIELELNGVKLALKLNINKNPSKDSYSIRSRHCNESAIEERVSKSQIILSCTCEDYRKGSQGGGTCEKSRIWRIIKGVNLLNDIKDLKTVRN